MTALAEMRRLLDVAVQSADRAESDSLLMPDLDGWPRSTPSDGDFRQLISGMYVWLRDLWPDQLNFLAGAAQRVALPASDVRGLRADVDHLRTFQQHALDPLNPRDAELATAVGTWHRRACGTAEPASTEEWLRCGETIVAQATAALRQLITIIQSVRADANLLEEWKRLFGDSDVIDFIELRRGMAADLGLMVRSRDADYLDRQIERRWRRQLTRGGATNASLARSVVLRELAAWSTQELPVDLDDIMDHLGLAAGRQALGAVRLAHAVWESVAFDDVEEFLDVLVVAWDWLMER